MKKENRIKLIILSLGVLLRLILSLINEDYNDDHVTPILLWLKNGEYPAALACWECFQPPFYYWIVKLICSAFGLSEFNEVLTVFRVLGFIFSVLVLYVVVYFINKQQLPNKFKYPLMLFWTLNPELISIGALNTNDTALILLGCFAFLFIYKYWQKPTFKGELVILCLIFLMGITKGNGLVYLFIFGVVWLIIAIKQFKLKHWLRMASMVLVMVSLTAYVGRYYNKYQRYGDPFLINQHKQPFPNLLTPDDEYQGRKGVTSIVQTFGTFRLGSLLETPYNMNGSDDYPLHRTSILTQLYGQFSNYLFERHPHSWTSVNNDMKNFARLNYILHLPLFVLMLFSFFVACKNTILSGITLQSIAVIVITLFLLFLFKYSITYRDFSNMKVIFMYPGFLALVSLSFSWFKYKLVKKWLNGLLVVCSVLYVVNYVYLLLALLN